MGRYMELGGWILGKWRSLSARRAVTYVKCAKANEHSRRDEAVASSGTVDPVMTLQQLRILRQAVLSGFSLSKAAQVLFTSQSGVSRHIIDLELELGVPLFNRKGKRILGLTDAGREVYRFTERIVQETENLDTFIQALIHQDEGELTLATTHTQARYALPEIINSFRLIYPKVRLAMIQAAPPEIAELVRSGRAQIGIATESLGEDNDFETFPFYAWYHGVIVPRTHPLAKEPGLTLVRLAQYPILTYMQGFTGRPKIDLAFAQLGLQPQIVLSALDADVIKTYVAMGFGVGIVASMAFDEDLDTQLLMLDASHLFPRNTTVLATRKGSFRPNFVSRFIALCNREDRNTSRPAPEIRSQAS